MSCPACDLDYTEMEQHIDRGNISLVESMIDELSARHTEKKGVVIVFCPSCQEILSRLRSRVASHLRKQTLGNIHNLLDEAYDRRKQGKAK
jgi:hypothetical protein